MNPAVPRSPAGPDPLGWRMEVQEALAQPELTAFNGDPSSARRAAYRLAVALGHCRLFGIELGEQDGTLPVAVGLAAAEQLVEHLRAWEEDARRLPRRWELATEPVEAADFALDLLIARMEAWAAYLAIDEAYQECLESAAAKEAAFAAALDAVFDALKSLDETLHQHLDLLALAADTHVLDNWRQSLAEEFRTTLPWWLDGTLEETARSVAEQALAWQPQGEKMTAEQGQASIMAAEALAVLEAFVVDNDDLLALESRIGRFNIFDALGIARAEIRHSNFLAFILDPAESHGQGQLFLKAILMDLLKAAPAGSRPLSPIELDGTDLRGVEVRREWEHIDILITSQQPPFVVAIENKVDAEEHSGQLGRYKMKVKQQHSQQALFVYLTPDADEPRDGDWMPYSYTDVFGVLTRVLATYRKAIGEDVLVFLDHYLNLIGTRFMNDAKIDELCQRIYKNHRQALDLIIERRGLASGVLAEAAAVLRDDTRWHVFYQTSKEIYFVPKAWLEWLPELGLDRKGDRRSWIVLCLQLSDEGWLGFLVQVRRMEDLAKRREIVEKLTAEGQKFGFKYKKGHKVKDFYTAVSGRERILKWAEDNEPDSDAIRAAVQKKIDEVFLKFQDIPSLLKPLFNLTESSK